MTRQMRTVWERYSLSIVLVSLFLASWVGQGVTEWFVVRSDAAEHGQQAGLGDFVVQFGQSTLENWQSEFLQLLTFVVLTAFLVHVGSPESRDTDESMQEALRRLERKVDELTRSERRGERP